MIYVVLGRPFFSFFLSQWINTLKAHFLNLDVSRSHTILIKVQVVSELLDVDILSLGNAFFSINQISQIIESHFN